MEQTNGAEAPEMNNTFTPTFLAQVDRQYSVSRDDTNVLLSIKNQFDPDSHFAVSVWGKSALDLDTDVKIYCLESVFEEIAKMIHLIQVQTND